MCMENIIHPAGESQILPPRPKDECLSILSKQLANNTKITNYVLTIPCFITHHDKIMMNPLGLLTEVH